MGAEGGQEMNEREKWLKLTNRGTWIKYRKALSRIERYENLLEFAAKELDKAGSITIANEVRTHITRTRK